MTTKTFQVTTPVEGFTGAVAGVDFVKGTAEVPGDNAAALAYFRRHGYGVEEAATEQAADGEGEGNAADAQSDGKPKRAPAKKAAPKKAADPKQGDGQGEGDGGTPPAAPKE